MSDNTMAKRKKDKQHLQNITHKTKDLVTRTPLYTNNIYKTLHIKLKIE